MNQIDGLVARNEYAALLTHAIDHLNGILYIDYQHAGIHT
jgi:peptide deformylase